MRTSVVAEYKCPEPLFVTIGRFFIASFTIVWFDVFTLSPIMLTRL